MKHASLLAAAAIVLVADAFALIHAWRNRIGPVEADVTLTERELPIAYNSSKDDSGVALQLRWIDPGWPIFGGLPSTPWLDQKILEDLGFDTSVPPSDPKAADFYQRQRARRGFVALEYDGAAWRKHLEEADRENRERAGSPQANLPPHSHQFETHLLVIDASADPVRLRARHPDRSSVIVVPAVVRIVLQPPSRAAAGSPLKPAALSGSVQEIPSFIHVPRPFSDALRRSQGTPGMANYRVHLRYGASFEPWIVGIAFPPPANP